MTGKTHQILGLTVGLWTFIVFHEPKYNPASLAAVLVVSHLAALMPDIDRPAAKLWQILPLGKLAGELADEVLSHRNITHSLLGFAVFAGASSYLLGLLPEYWGLEGSTVWLAALFAYGSHLFADMLTVEGIPLLLPWTRSIGIPPKPLQGLRIVTGKWFENMVIFPSLNIIFWVLLVGYWTYFKLVLFR